MGYSKDNKSNESIQKSFCELHKALYKPASLDKVVGVAWDTIFDSPFNGLRHPETAETSGWYFWGGENKSSATNFFQPVHLSHLIEKRPEIIKYLGLEPGWRFLTDIDSGYEDIWYDASLLDVS